MSARRASRESMPSAERASSAPRRGRRRRSPPPRRPPRAGSVGTARKPLVPQLRGRDRAPLERVVGHAVAPVLHLQVAAHPPTREGAAGRRAGSRGSARSRRATASSWSGSVARRSDSVSSVPSGLRSSTRPFHSARSDSIRSAASRSVSSVSLRAVAIDEEAQLRRVAVQAREHLERARRTA